MASSTPRFCHQGGVVRRGEKRAEVLEICGGLRRCGPPHPLRRQPLQSQQQPAPPKTPPPPPKTPSCEIGRLIKTAGAVVFKILRALPPVWNTSVLEVLGTFTAVLMNIDALPNAPKLDEDNAPSSNKIFFPLRTARRFRPLNPPTRSPNRRDTTPSPKRRTRRSAFYIVRNLFN